MIVIFIFCLIAPGTVFYYLSPLGIRPDLIMLWTIYFALHTSPRIALWTAFAMGLLTDLYIGSNLGLHTFALCAVAAVSIWLQKRWDKDNMMLVTLLVFSVTLAGQGVMVLLAALSGIGWAFGAALRVAVGVSLYNALLVLLTYPLIHRSFTKGWLRKRARYELTE
jgi:rod shape-determining protein MreD